MAFVAIGVSRGKKNCRRMTFSLSHTQPAYFLAAGVAKLFSTLAVEVPLLLLCGSKTVDNVRWLARVEPTTTRRRKPPRTDADGKMKKVKTRERES